MAVTTLSSREFGKHIGRAKKAARNGPVFINDHGKPSYVLLTVEHYWQLTAERDNSTSRKAPATSPKSAGKSKMSIVDMLAMPPGFEDVELEIPRDYPLSRPIDFD